MMKHQVRFDKKVRTALAAAVKTPRILISDYITAEETTILAVDMEHEVAEIGKGDSYSKYWSQDENEWRYANYFLMVVGPEMFDIKQKYPSYSKIGDISPKRAKIICEGWAKTSLEETITHVLKVYGYWRDYYNNDESGGADYIIKLDDSRLIGYHPI